MPISSTSILPVPGYVTVHDILEGKVAKGALVNVCGVVHDFRAPIPTRNKDWKCQIRLFDSSVDDGDSIAFNVFRPEKEIPSPGCGDVMLIRQARVQLYGSEAFSLLTHYSTRISVYKASKIPNPPGEASCALYPPNSSKDSRPSDKENSFVSEMYHTIDKSRIPSQEEFETMVVTSANLKNKFGLLADVQGDRFYDIVAQVVRPPHDEGDKITIWVSDYTENSAFHNFSINVDGTSLGRDGDPYGYTDKFTKASDWPGPFGKRCIQITCWEPHATVIRDEKIEALAWVLIKNLQVKLGHNGANLEGYLREDRGSVGPKINIRMLDTNTNSENFDPRAKEALQRKREYERLRKGQLKDIKEASKAGQKRKNGTESNTEPKKDNSRAKRAKKRAKQRASIQGEASAREQGAIPVADLNTQVKCENQDKPVSLISEITSVVRHETTINGDFIKLSLPFVNLNYRANVRVVDFSPSNLTDFAYPKKESEYDDLSDDGEESVSNSETDDENGQPKQRMMDDFTKVRNWEWRFFLELEDAAVPGKPEKKRLWVAVDNQSAQCLVGLDASNLRQDREALAALRDKMFTLWGNLEEKKVAAQEAARKGKPPADSDDEDQQQPETKESDKTQLTNRAFPCCIQQYGIKVAESDPSKANAGKGKRWQRMFRLFGAMIAGA
ncbi:Protection of telomeres protein 1 [Fusarium austroafricanum]|uniref:Protection of telomeres protein 1 n=1 Tax=Fusarium austroafricanum TaxID=2364996 RepID=A0A8H4KIW7_9HYPO|nr:Protection of telomeres protein 1 [Fusarium austroafricanum]